MEFSRNTSRAKTFRSLVLFIKTLLGFLVIFAIVVLLNKIDFPSPNKEIKNFIPNDNLKIVK
jgi:hypothetical protein|tara:strand:+ start:267 stop:452 length:186 start_codon:yes stop_codon:yes gene_type:complete